MTRREVCHHGVVISIEQQLCIHIASKPSSVEPANSFATLTSMMKLLCLIALLLISQNARVLVKSDASVDDVTDDYQLEITELKKQNQLMKATMEELTQNLLCQGEKLAHQEKEFKEKLNQQEQMFEEQLVRQEEKLLHQEEAIASLKDAAVRMTLDDVTTVKENAVVAGNGN